MTTKEPAAIQTRQFTKKPVTIEAIQWTGRMDCIDAFNIPELHQSLGSQKVGIPTLEGTMIADIGDWIIKGVNGEFYPCKPDIFELTYSATPAPAPGPILSDERTLFEAAARKGLDTAISGFDFQRNDDDEYKWFATRRLYEFWKEAGRTALASVPGQSEPDRVYETARNLALVIWRDNYRDDAPKFEPLDDLAGVISQIDNMVCGMTRRAAAAEPDDTAIYSYRMKLADGSFDNWKDCSAEHASHVMQREFASGFEVRKLYAHPAAAGPSGEMPKPWQQRVKDQHPNSDPQYWPESLMLKNMSAEIAEWRSLHAAEPAPTDLAKLRELAIAAESVKFTTEGFEQTEGHGQFYGGLIMHENGHTIIAQCVLQPWADFIAAANPAAILSLIAVVEGEK
ncbi:MAG: hypothetical protein WA191_07170 [Telluria sp.]